MADTVPSLKTVIMATVRPEIKALIDIYKDEINYMHQVLEQQNLVLQQLHDVMLFMQSSMASLIGYNTENMVEMQLRQVDVKRKTDYTYMMVDKHEDKIDYLEKTVAVLKDVHDIVLSLQYSLASYIGSSTESIVNIQTKQFDTRQKVDYVYTIAPVLTNKLENLRTDIQDLQTKVNQLIQQHQS